MKRLLSVDWDFFPEVTQETLTGYPGGRELSTEESITAWRACYARDSSLTCVRINTGELQALRDVLGGQDRSIPVVAAQSHVGAYGLVLDCLADGELAEIVNLDFHHDLANENPGLDCGNWVGRLILSGRTSGKLLSWVHNPASFPMYGIRTKAKDEFSATMHMIDGGTSMRALAGQQFDMVFLARSDAWTPPHLDGEFAALVCWMRERFPGMRVYDGVDIPRGASVKIERCA